MTQLSLSPRAARTRTALLVAGMELLGERPVDAIAIDEFVTAAGVAKGSFFNHFLDKQQFAGTIATEIRMEVEQWVARVNAGISDPLERLAGGMIAAAAYALACPRRTAVLARSYNGMSLDDHPINAGLLRDLRDALDAKLIDLPSEQAGVLYWLGACQTVMGNIFERRTDQAVAHHLLVSMLQLALRGLAAQEDRIAAIAHVEVIKRRLILLASTNAEHST